jgi:F-type H+-transporting ATPase subunit epsilon
MADTSLFLLKLVTPERILVDGLASEVILRTGDGDITFLAGHAPLVGTVRPGVVRVVPDEGEVVRVATHGGFVQVEHGTPSDGSDGGSPSGTTVTLLIGVAELAEEIDADRARAALEAAESHLAELGGGRGASSGAALAEGEEVDPEVAEAEAGLLRAQVRLEAIDATAGAGTA